jgi:hypothetical protein
MLEDHLNSTIKSWKDDLVLLLKTACSQVPCIAVFSSKEINKLKPLFKQKNFIDLDLLY